MIQCRTHLPKLIVVGVDGSDAATAALRWACTEATDTGAAIEVVHAFRPNVGPMTTFEDSQAQSALLLSREVWVGLATVLNPPPISVRSKAGAAAAVLISRSAQAGLLVLGATEYAAGDTKRFGSTAANCQQNARCPVAVISRSGQCAVYVPQQVPKQRSYQRYCCTAPPGNSQLAYSVSPM